MEYVFAAGFLGCIWLFGYAFVSALGRRSEALLALPIGLSIAGLVGNGLYFGVGASIAQVQDLLLVLLIVSAWTAFRRTTVRDLQALAVPLILFGVLSIPAWIGGEQYFVFRGNHGDHFNYIDQSLAIFLNTASYYRTTPPAELLSSPVLVHGAHLLNMRPVVGLVFAIMLPRGHGNIHLFAYLYNVVLWVCIFPAIDYLLRQFKLGRCESKWGRAWIGAIPIAYTIGFWGQYVFDINAWSQLASTSILIATAALAWKHVALGRSLESVRRARIRHLHVRSWAAMAPLYVLVAGALVFYAENTAFHLALISTSALLVYFHRRRLPTRAEWSLVAIAVVAVVALAVVPNPKSTVGFLVDQIRFGAQATPAAWAGYFDSYWQGIGAARSRPEALVNFLLATCGFFFVTPFTDVTGSARVVWTVCDVIVLLVVLFSLTRLFSFIKNGRSLLLWLTSLVAIGLALVVVLCARGSVWSAGKALSYIAPYLWTVLLVPLILSTNYSAKRTVTFARMTAGLLVLAQLTFGLSRIALSRDPRGIGLSNLTYPSIQQNTLKENFDWRFDASQFDNCKRVGIVGDPGPLYTEYLMQKLAYRGISSESSRPVEQYTLNGKFEGLQPRLPVDCKLELNDQGVDIWRTTTAQGTFTGRVDFVNRPPLTAFVGFADAGGGSWTTGEVASVVVPGYLPERFELTVSVAMVFGKNDSYPLKVSVGGVVREVLVDKPGTYTLRFENIPRSSRIDFHVPHPQSPMSLGQSTDPRELGFAFTFVDIRNLR